MKLYIKGGLMFTKIKKWYRKNVEYITVFGVFTIILFFLYLGCVFILAQTMRLLGYDL